MEDTSAVAETPVGSSESSGGSTGESSSAPARPASMQAALEQADSQFADHGGAPPDGASAQGGRPVTPQGPIPFQVHQTALKNARTKAQAEALRGITPEQFSSMLQWYQRAQQDTPGFLTTALAEHPQAIEILQRALQTLQTHPTHGAQLKTLAAKALAAARGQQQGPQPPQMVRVELSDGSVMETPRDYRAALAYERQQWEEGVGKQLAPISQTVQTLKQEYDAAVMESQIESFVGSTMEEVKSFPGVDDAGMKEMAEFLKTVPMNDPNDPREIQRAVDLAYRKVIVPHLSQNAQRAYGASLKQKAVANMETASSRAAAPLAKPKSVSDLARYLETLETGGGR